MTEHDKEFINELVERAIQTWIALSETPGAMLAYQARKKQILDEEAAKRELELRIQESYRMGFKQGSNKGVAQRLLDKGYSVADTVDLSALSEEQVLKIKEDPNI